MKNKMGIIRIGISGIVVPGTKQSFPVAFQQKSRLHYYSTLFNTIEINSSFYKVPMASTFAKWSQDVGDNFKLTIKLWREITHVKELKFDLDGIDHFMKAADNIGDKKGCMLIQFPGKISFEYYSQLEEILRRVSENDPFNQWRKAVEFRSAGWYVSETFELLDEYNASVVLHDIPKGKNNQVNKSANFIYIRFHGPEGNYRGSYSDEQLRDISFTIKAWVKQGKDVYAYFNNTMGSAFENAITLQGLTTPGGFIGRNK